jgi:hypothetical protein
MRRPKFLWKSALIFCAVATFPNSSFGQSSLPRLAVGGRLSSMGIGIEAATSVTQRSNVRGSFNFYNYDRTLLKDGIDYDGTLRLRSVQVTYDQYLFWKDFHVSPGLLLYNGNRATAEAAVPAGRSFTLGGTTFFSNPADPITGSGTLEVRKVAPMILVGFGNMLPRSDKHFGMNFDAGVAFQGTPEIKLGLSGTACAVNATTACASASGDPIVLSAIQREQSRLQDEVNVVKFYPVVSVGISWKF